MSGSGQAGHDRAMSSLASNQSIVRQRFAQQLDTSSELSLEEWTEQKREQASNLLQAQYRGYRTRKNHGKEKQKRQLDKAARLLQRWMLRWKERRHRVLVLQAENRFSDPLTSTRAIDLHAKACSLLAELDLGQVQPGRSAAPAKDPGLTAFCEKQLKRREVHLRTRDRERKNQGLVRMEMTSLLETLNTAPSFDEIDKSPSLMTSWRLSSESMTEKVRYDYESELRKWEAELLFDRVNEDAAASL